MDLYKPSTGLTSLDQMVLNQIIFEMKNGQKEVLPAAIGEINLRLFDFSDQSSVQILST